MATEVDIDQESIKKIQDQIKNVDIGSDKPIKIILFICATIATIFIFFIIIFLFTFGADFFLNVSLDHFLFGQLWVPNRGNFGASALIIGTILVTLGAMVIAIPLGLATAIFIAELAPKRLARYLKLAVEILSGIPSIVYGFFGATILTVIIENLFQVDSGFSWLAGSIILAIMALPTIVSVCEDALTNVPRIYKEASLGLGATKWQTISQVTVPAAMSGITAGIILGIGRAIGETMAVLVVTGGQAVIPNPFTNVFSGLKPITAAIAIELGEATGLHESALFALGIILFLITLFINISANLILSRLQKKFSGETGKEKKLKRFSLLDTQRKKYLIISIIGMIIFFLPMFILIFPGRVDPTTGAAQWYFGLRFQWFESTSVISYSLSLIDMISSLILIFSLFIFIYSLLSKKTSILSDLKVRLICGALLVFIPIAQIIFYAIILTPIYSEGTGFLFLPIGLLFYMFVGSYIIYNVIKRNLEEFRNLKLILRKFKRPFILAIGFCLIGLILNNWFGILPTIIILAGFIGFYLLMRYSQPKIHQRINYILISVSALIVLIILAILIFFIFALGIPALSSPGFLTTESRGPQGGILDAIVGTLLLTGGTVLFSVPIGVLAGIYLSEYAKKGKVTRLIRSGIDNLNGTPSIVFALFGYLFFIRYLRLGGGQYNLLAGQLTLALMILPTVIKTTEESVKSIPQSFRKGSLALGSTKWQSIYKVVLPSAIPGIITGIILGMGRAAGETAPLIYTACVSTGAGWGDPTQPVNALTYHLYILLIAYKRDEALFAAGGTAIMLLFLVLIFYGVAIIIRNHYRKKKEW